MQDQAPLSSATDSPVVTDDAEISSQALQGSDLEALDELLDDLRSRAEEIPQWEFCDGFLTALVCTRRAIPVQEYLPMLLGDGAELQVESGQPLPVIEAFKDRQQQDYFLAQFERRMQEVREQLDADVKTLDDDRTFQPEAMDMRGAILSLPEAERADMEGQEIPSLGQIWALGFMFVVENWADEWAAPRDKEAADWLNEALNSVVELTEDDTGKPVICMYDENGPASTSQARVDSFGEAIWAVYDLRQLWKSLGPRQETIVKGVQAGRNDPCPCGSGKKFKKCHGA